ncbi:MAG: SMI1/KNR4 family protein [Gemmataceae bacterium]|nr:SMI1/KNR4 family protein [Gemmataceae bacterium]
METSFDAIRHGLERLRTAKRQPKVFGAESHRFKLHPPLSESTVRKFEAKHHIRLPEDYRGFLLNLGNGGAGPFYGVFKLGEMDDCYGFKKWKEGDGFVGLLAKPFPHTAAWNEQPPEPEETDDEEEYEKRLDACDAVYWNSENVNGAIPLCHEGCALRDWLVLTGPEAGHMWHDARADEAGLWPISVGKKRRVTFLEWYIHWLNEALAKLPMRRG